MSDPINLRQVRKAKARADHAKTGAQNRVTFGGSKAERTMQEAQAVLNVRKLDGSLLQRREKNPNEPN